MAEMNALRRPSYTPFGPFVLRSVCYQWSMPKSHFRIPAYDGPLRRRIRLLVKANPKRGKAALRFAKYRDGMTVEEYIRACERRRHSRLRNI